MFLSFKWNIVAEDPEKKGEYFEDSEAPEEMLSKLQRVEERLLKKFELGSSVAYISLSELNNTL